MSKIDWSDPEQVRAYRREWRMKNAGRINEKRREEHRNRPAAPGVRGRGGPNKGFMDAAFSIENFQDEISWDINLDKYLEGNEE
jgi:hypothetical protein